jgi:hypothetical protein
MTSHPFGHGLTTSVREIIDRAVAQGCEVQSIEIFIDGTLVPVRVLRNPRNGSKISLSNHEDDDGVTGDFIERIERRLGVKL